MQKQVIKKEAPDTEGGDLVKEFNVQSLLTQAINKGVPVETIERLLAVAKDMQGIYAKREFDRSMAAFQAECPTIQKTKEVKTDSGARAYRYAPIESIVDQVKDLLQKHGFSYSSNMELIENGSIKVKVTIRVTHEAGHSEVSEMTVPLGAKTRVMSDTQVVAAAQTFAKRYAFCNAFGILTGDEDTDARPTQQTWHPGMGVPAETASQLQKELHDLMIEKKIAFLKDVGIKRPRVPTISWLKDTIEQIKDLPEIPVLAPEQEAEIGK